MSIMDDVKGALKTRQGKVVAVGLVGGLGYLWYTRGRNTPPADTGELGTTAQTPIAPTAGGSGTSTTPATVVDNETWLSRAVSALTNPPYNMDPAAVYDALRRALDGLSLTAAQQAIVSKAIGIIGTPPEGMPPLNSTIPDPVTPVTPTPVTPTPPAVDPPFLNGHVQKGWFVDTWINDVRRSPGGNPNFTWELLQLWNPDVSLNINWVKTSSQRTFKNPTVYRINWTGKTGAL